MNCAIISPPSQAASGNHRDADAVNRLLVEAADRDSGLTTADCLPPPTQQRKATGSRVSAELLDQPPPAAVESERVFLSAALIDGRINPDAVIEPFHFSVPEHAILFAAMSSLDGEHGQFDQVMLLPLLRDNDCEFNWAALLGELASEHGVASLMPQHADKIRQAHARRTIGQTALQIFRESWNGSFDPAVLQKHLDRIGRVVSNTSQGPGTRLPIIEDAYDFCKQYLAPPGELVAGLIHRGSKVSLGGGSKAYKSWLLLYLAMCVAYGRPFLDCATDRCRVLVVNLELQAAFCWKRLKTLAQALAIDQQPGRLDIWNLRGYAGGYQDVIPKIIEGAANKGYGLIIPDPIYKLYGQTDENCARDVAALLNSLETVAVQTGAAVVFGAHYSKGNQASKSAIDRVSGSGVFARDPDTILNLTAHDKSDCYTVDVTLRNFPPMEPFVVRWEYPLFVRDANLNPAELKKAGQSEERKQRREEKFQETQRRILQAAAKYKTGETKTVIRDQAGLNDREFQPAFAALLDSGELLLCEITKPNRKKPYPAYILVSYQTAQEGLSGENG